MILCYRKQLGIRRFAIVNTSDRKTGVFYLTPAIDSGYSPHFNYLNPGESRTAFQLKPLDAFPEPDAMTDDEYRRHVLRLYHLLVHALNQVLFLVRELET